MGSIPSHPTSGRDPGPCIAVIRAVSTSASVSRALAGNPVLRATPSDPANRIIRAPRTWRTRPSGRTPFHSGGPDLPGFPFRPGGPDLPGFLRSGEPELGEFLLGVLCRESPAPGWEPLCCCRWHMSSWSTPRGQGLLGGKILSPVSTQVAPQADLQECCSCTGLCMKIVDEHSLSGRCGPARLSSRGGRRRLRPRLRAHPRHASRTPPSPRWPAHVRGPARARCVRRGRS